MLNRFLEKKRIRLSFQEFFQLERGEITLEEIYYNRKLDLFAVNVLASKYKNIILIVIASGLIVLNSELALATTIDTSKVDNLGSTVLSLIRTCGYWFCLALASKEIITQMINGTTKEIGSIIVKYLTAFGAFYALPWIMDLIKDLLS